MQRLKSLKNPFELPGKWYKANLHTHTTASDGQMSLEDRIKQYRGAGYNVLAITDHGTTSNCRNLSDKNMLIISGMEYHPHCQGSAEPHHLVGIDVPKGFGFDKPDPNDANACISAVKAVGSLTFLAHPLWCGHRYDMYSYMRDLVGVEVYNSACGRIGRSDSETDWCHLLDAGRIIPALAVDDSHDKEDRFGGWVWLRMRSLTLRSVMSALQSGCYYSSTGPKIHDFRLRRGVVEVTCSPVRSIYLMAHSRFGTRRMAEDGKSIRKFSAPVGEKWKYVRAVVTDHAGKKAWTNPIAL